MPTKSKSLTTTERRLAPVHPGEVLREEFIIPMGLSAGRVASDIGVPLSRINDIVLCRRAVTADTALRLAKYFGTSATFWLGLQTDYDLDVEGDRLVAELKSVPRVDLSRPAELRGRPPVLRSAVPRGVTAARVNPASLVTGHVAAAPARRSAVTGHYVSVARGSRSNSQRATKARATPAKKK